MAVFCSSSTSCFPGIIIIIIIELSHLTHVCWSYHDPHRVVPSVFATCIKKFHLTIFKTCSPSHCKPSLPSANEYWVHWLNRLDYLWNFPIFPVPDVIILEILSAIEFFLCEEETLYAATYFSGTINRRIFSAVIFNQLLLLNGDYFLIFLNNAFNILA